jgi:hypothetical protein
MGRLLDGLPPMIVEFIPPWLRERGVDPVQVVEGFQRLGYDIAVPQAGLASGANAAEVVSTSDSQQWGSANLELTAARP